MKLKNKKSRNIIGIIQSCLIFALVILVIFMMIQINRLQGTARVINYAGLVRGATQREVKLEITGSPNDELIKYLDDILSGLKYQDGNYDLVKLRDKEYQDKLQVQIDYWNKIKKEIEAVRSSGYENTDIVNMSETYFKLADDTVSAAENYSEKIATKIRTIELLSALDMLCLVILIIVQTIMAMKMARQNKLLEQRAYTDARTGLPNRSACKEILNNNEIISSPTACIIFDLNNLKFINDTMGHSAGDRLIVKFAGLLRSVFPEKDFVGRYGGDEFMVVIYDTDKAEVSLFMDACDVIYTKPGGLTSTEALVKNIPIVHTAPIPGCEAANVAFFKKRHLSVSSKRLSKQVELGKIMIENKELNAEMIRAQRRERKPYAAIQIVGLLEELAHTDTID